MSNDRKDWVVGYTGFGKVKASQSKPMTRGQAVSECDRLNKQLRANGVGGWHNVYKR